MTTSQSDLTIDELLGDPITHAIMKADRVDPLEFEAMLRALPLWAARAAGQPEDDIRSAERTPFACNAGGRFLSSTGSGRGESAGVSPLDRAFDRNSAGHRIYDRILH